MKSKLRFFGKEIAPSCNYCENAITDAITEPRCIKNKHITEQGKCSRFVYAPQKREPKSPLFLPKFTADDFKL